jgi:uracil-DNA glycosylase
VLAHVLLTNAVPFKPPGNRAYPPRVLEAFRPHVEHLLACHWQGEVVFALGQGAFQWFAPYAAPAGAGEPEGAPLGWEQTCLRGEGCLCRLPTGSCVPPGGARELVIVPLPHPSPANASWASRFDGLLAERLARWLAPGSRAVHD